MFASTKNKVLNCQQARVPALGTPVLFKKRPPQNPKVSLLDQPGDVPTSLVEEFVHDFSKTRVVRV